MRWYAQNMNEIQNEYEILMAYQYIMRYQWNIGYQVPQYDKIGSERGI